MVRLSVNVNKVATLRNARGGREPDMIEAVDACLRAGAPGITVHPRADQRHITPTDVQRISERLAGLRDRVEYNIEGDPRPDLIDLVCTVKPHQCTLVPVMPGEITSQAGWPPGEMREQLVPVIKRLHDHGVRVSLFVEPDTQAIDWAAQLGADRVELYTEPFARAFEQGEGPGQASYQAYVQAAKQAHKHGLGVNAGHDLDLANLELFAQLPHLDEVSIGHALMSRALFFGIEAVVREYLDKLHA
ncbi:MAG: pyridoxine 5'-phosphate synthase [Nannocystaceae bacterium]